MQLVEPKVDQTVVSWVALKVALLVENSVVYWAVRMVVMRE